MPIAPIVEIIAEVKAGRMVVLVDEEDRENEGDLVFAADCVTPEAINFMARYGRGLICLHAHRGALRGSCNLTPMTPENRSVHGTNFTVSIEAAHGVTTGISAADPRAYDTRRRGARTRGPRTSSSPATSFRWWRSPAACWCARAIPKRAAISRAGRPHAGRRASARS